MNGKVVLTEIYLPLIIEIIGFEIKN